MVSFGGGGGVPPILGGTPPNLPTFVSFGGSPKSANYQNHLGGTPQVGG